MCIDLGAGLGTRVYRLSQSNDWPRFRWVGVYTEAKLIDFYMCVRDRFQLTPKVQAFMDYMVEALPIEW